MATNEYLPHFASKHLACRSVVSNECHHIVIVLSLHCQNILNIFEMLLRAQRVLMTHRRETIQDLVVSNLLICKEGKIGKLKHKNNVCRAHFSHLIRSQTSTVLHSQLYPQPKTSGGSCNASGSFSIFSHVLYDDE